jgi:hypothetical protein
MTYLVFVTVLNAYLSLIELRYLIFAQWYSLTAAVSNTAATVKPFKSVEKRLTVSQPMEQQVVLQRPSVSNVVSSTTYILVLITAKCISPWS